MNSESILWTAPEGAILPDFIISGAMKCGTTSLHAILEQHPDVYIPQPELHFYDMDDVIQHPDFNQFSQNTWLTPQFEKRSEYYWQWYSSQFQNASANQLKGEDSTTYLASEFAFKRIAQQKKDIKIVIMLRQPSARVYSHYWHMVKAGRALFNFEDSLKFSPYNLLERSAYLKQLKLLFTYIKQTQVKVIVFEDFIANKEQTMMDICDFLGLDFSKLPQNALNIHANHSRIPRFINLHLLKSKFFRHTSNCRYLNHFADSEHDQSISSCTSVFERFYRLINPLVRKKPVNINPETKKFLDEYFYKELKGLDELLGQDILSRWFD